MELKVSQPERLWFPTLEIWINPNFSTKITQKVLVDITNNTDVYFDGNIIKNAKATTIVETRIGEEKIIIKRINVQNFFTIFRRLFCLSRAERNWKFSYILNENDINTFTPVMLVMKKFFGLKLESYVYMSKIDGLDARYYFEKCLFKIQWQTMADKIIQLVKKLNRIGIRHRDLNLSNIMIFKNTPYLIDLDAMKKQRMFFSASGKKEQEKFIENIAYLKLQNNELFNYFNQAFNGKEHLI